MTRSRTQLEQSARQLLRNAYATGATDEEAIESAVAAMGKEHGGIVARVQAREFKTYGGAG